MPRRLPKTAPTPCNCERGLSAHALAMSSKGISPQLQSWGYPEGVLKASEESAVPSPAPAEPVKERLMAADPTCLLSGCQPRALRAHFPDAPRPREHARAPCSVWTSTQMAGLSLWPPQHLLSLCPSLRMGTSPCPPPDANEHALGRPLGEFVPSTLPALFSLGTIFLHINLQWHIFEVI